ncbi:MAG TPA: hypothetical protein VGO43_04355 [Pyrinomonadaceae bacterium]|nr:hypothetical protein [Pyrinomonadaceae bacterium]
MKFEKGIKKKYRDSIELAFNEIVETGNEQHKRVMNTILASHMLVRVGPVSEVQASGRTGLISSIGTNARLLRERLSLKDSLGEIYISIAEETIDTGGQRGCEGTFVHEGQHAYDFATALASFSNRDMNPLDIFDPTLYELEWNAHKSAGDYMVCRGIQDYLDEGLQLMILDLGQDGKCFVNDDGIRQRLRESYSLALDADQGPSASRMMGIVV